MKNVLLAIALASLVGVSSAETTICYDTNGRVTACPGTNGWGYTPYTPGGQYGQQPSPDTGYGQDTIISEPPRQIYGGKRGGAKQQ